MLHITTLTLAAKISQELDIGINKVVIASGDYILGKIKSRDESYTLPAMSIFRSGLSPNYEPGDRPFAARSGDHYQKGDTSAIMLYVIPVIGTYSINVITPDLDSAEKVEGNIIWFVEDEKKSVLPIKVTIEGEEAELPVEVSATAGTTSLSRAVQEEWEGTGRLYRIEFDLSVNTYLLKSEIKPIIRTIGLEYKYFGSEIILESQVISADDL
jgi:hypothetical protein